MSGGILSCHHPGANNINTYRYTSECKELHSTVILEPQSSAIPLAVCFFQEVMPQM